MPAAVMLGLQCVTKLSAAGPGQCMCLLSFSATVAGQGVCEGACLEAEDGQEVCPCSPGGRFRSPDSAFTTHPAGCSCFCHVCVWHRHPHLRRCVVSLYFLQGRLLMAAAFYACRSLDSICTHLLTTRLF